MKRHLQNIALVVGALVLSAVGAEGIARWQDEQPLLTRQLVSGSLPVKAVSPHDLPLARGVSRSWFSASPPPLPNRETTPPEWRAPTTPTWRLLPRRRRTAGCCP